MDRKEIAAELAKINNAHSLSDAKRIAVSLLVQLAGEDPSMQPTVYREQQ